MSKLLAPDTGMKQVDIDGYRLTRNEKDGAFHVSGELARRLKSTGDFTEAGMNLSKVAKGHWCPNCKFMAVFKKCGRCGSEDTIPDTELEDA
jgi:hypothetical protein